LRAAAIDGYGGPDVIRLVELPEPEPGPGQVRIRVAGASVNPTDLKLRAGDLADWVPATFPWILGWDVAGTVEAVGAGSAREVGEPVVAMWDQHFVAAGSYAERVALDAALVAPAPVTTDLVSAAALPLAAVTASQVLDLLDLPRGARLLVTGASGVVGGVAAQLGGHRGLRVAGTARGEAGLETARRLGVERVLDAGEPIPARAFDAVVHTVGPAGVIDAVRDGGRYVTVLSGGVPPPQRGIEPAYHSVTADTATLGRVSELVDRGVLTPRLAGTMPLAAAAEAHRRQERGGVPGRLVLTP